MCQITVVNLHDNMLNKKLFLLMGSFGSVVHKDGWGIADDKKNAWKCAIPMHWTNDAGKILREKFPKNDGTFLGHIRQASPQVPVVGRNSHPFASEGITFAHNGKLTPKEEKNFILEEEVPDLDKEGKEQFDKNNVKKMKKVKRSDSLVFFEKFIENWKAEVVGGDIITDKFVKVLKDTMELFYGKFAMVFIIQGTFYIVRGKTADLYVSYYKESYEDESKVLGFAVNTSKEVLDNCTLLLSNLEQLNGRKAMTFTYPEILKEETIYQVKDSSLEIVGEIKENSAPATYNYNSGYNYSGAWENGASNFTPKTGTTKKDSTNFEKLQHEVFDFLQEYSLSPSDLQLLFWVIYELPLKKVNEDVLTHFTKKVIPRLANFTNKDMKKKLRKVLSGLPVRFFRYSDKSTGFSIEYPWMLNPKNIQNSFIRRLEGKS